MKLGLNIQINVNKIDKERMFKGDKGTYLNLTTFVDTTAKNKYDANGFISQTTTKEEREQKLQTPILGNVNVFYTDGGQESYTKPKIADDGFDDDVPW